MAKKQIWFTSDLHLGQVNIVSKLTKWDHATKEHLRDFESVADMNTHIINKINEYVMPDDELYILGDIFFGKDVYKVMSYLSKIKCSNKHLLFGNHDHLLQKKENLEVLAPIFISIGHYKELRVKFPEEGTDPNRDPWEGRQLICMSHYAMRCWNQSHRGSWQLHGHSHASLERNSHMINNFYNTHCTMDVGLDNVYRIFGEYRPISFDEIQERFKTRKQALKIDHHEPRK